MLQGREAQPDKLRSLEEVDPGPVLRVQQQGEETDALLPVPVEVQGT